MIVVLYFLWRTNCTQFLTLPNCVKLNFLEILNRLFLNKFYVPGIELSFTFLTRIFYLSLTNYKLFKILTRSNCYEFISYEHFASTTAACPPKTYISLYWTSGLWIRWRQFRSLLTVLNVRRSVATVCKILKAALLGYPSKAHNFHTNFRENS